MPVSCCLPAQTILAPEEALSVPAAKRHDPIPDDPRTSLVKMNAGQPSIAKRRARPTLRAMYTLSPIAASPICTPGQSESPEPAQGPLKIIEGKKCAIKSSSSIQDTPDPKHHPPTWISTPPTPPPELVRRSVTCRTRRSPGLVVITTSNSLPAASSSHAPARIPKRRASIAAMYTWRLHSSPDTLSVGRSSHEANVMVSSPLRSGSLALCEAAQDTAQPVDSKPRFHILGDTGTDTEENGPALCESPVEPVPPPLPRSSWDQGQTTDNVRRLYALLELLTTEIGYLIDLRVLVSVYLRQLPLLSARPLSRSHSSFSAISRVGSFTTISPLSVHPHSAPPEAAPGSNGKENPLPRPLLSASSIELLMRNIEEILDLHEHFVQELRQAVLPCGLATALDHHADSERRFPDSYEHMAPEVEVAINAVCTKFATESSRFNAYQSFCASHPEALDLIRSVQQQHPLEWHDFEQKCSAMASSFIDSGVEGTETPSSFPEGPLPRKRTSSLSSLDGAVRSLRNKTGLKPKDAYPFPVEPLKEQRSPHRLAFMDYMIKPVQRICKYPLLLDQLQTGKHVAALASRKSSVQVVVESATQAMRHVASSVDEARHRQDVIVQSTLMVSRICLSISHVSQSTPPQTLTPPFLNSLGTCLLAGPLDVIHYQSGKSLGSRGKLRTKYLGAMLYLGGYFLLVKVGKNKIYDPKHWMSLAEFDIIDVREDEALLPFSFRFISKGHQFELAASCYREKEVWLNAIKESLSEFSKWLDEPTASIHCDGKGDLVPSDLDGGPFESINALPTIQSIPELVNDDSNNSTESAPAGRVGDSNPSSLTVKPDATPSSAPPSRRSSSTSVRSIFSPLASDFGQIVISRASATARAVVEQGMHDVISEACVSARSRASTSEEDLLHTPTIARRKSRSSLAMSSLGLRKNRTTNDGVHIFRRRSLLECSDSLGRMPLSRTKSLALRRQAKKLPLISTSDPTTQSSAPSSSMPSPILIKNQPSSSSQSAASSPSEPQTPPVIARDESDKSSKSHRYLPGTMREFFQPRSTSPVPTPLSDVEPDDEDNAMKTITPGLFKRWAQGSLNHRRAQSAPEEDNTAHSKVAQLFDCDIRDFEPSLPSKTLLQPRAEEPPVTTNKRMSFFQRIKSIEVGY
ncbi:hypothetical protein BDN71DRAFT_882804 [Pleurotus eryngii]|uniref:DH domain-containing protein n=1 Tax=Pleurotus eryngii TaxID=5323 RepID=A0A9P5ZWZ8_PLEER|nr:hypothetical protein BDN71DRAFT_882804 [Pleurotus eryngii]